MFSLFTKKRHPASELYSHYSEEEKLTILATLFLAGTCDNHMVTQARINTELNVLNQWVTIFEVKASKSQELLDRMSPEMIISRLASFDKSKINNVLLMILEMLNCDGKLNEEEICFLFTVLEMLNISPEAFQEQMNHNRAVYDFFLK